MSKVSETKEKQTEVKSSTKWRRNIKEKVKNEWQLIIKILEMILCVVCLGLVMEPAKKGDLAKIHLGHFVFVFTIFIGYIVIISTFLIGRILGDRLPYRTVCLFSLIAAALFFVTGILLAIDRKRKYFHDEIFYEPRAYLLNLLASSTAFSFVSVIVFAVDAFYILKFKEDF